MEGFYNYQSSSDSNRMTIDLFTNRANLAAFGRCIF
jgi:hypothetical protein